MNNVQNGQFNGIPKQNQNNESYFLNHPLKKASELEHLHNKRNGFSPQGLFLRPTLQK